MSQGKLRAGRRQANGTLELGDVIDINSPNGIVGSPIVGNLSSTKAIVFFQDNVDSKVKAKVVTKNGLALTLGVARDIANSSIPNFVCPMSSSLVVLGYLGGGTAIACSIFDDTITPGSPENLPESSVYLSACRLTATLGLASYVLTTSSVVRTAIFSVSGTTITFIKTGDTTDFSSLENSIVRISSSEAAICYRRNGGNTLRLSALYDASEDGYTRGDDILLASSALNNPPGIPMLCKLTDSLLVATYTDISTPADLHAVLATYSGSGSLALTDSTTVDDADEHTNYHAAAARINDTRSLAAWFKYNVTDTSLQIWAETQNVSPSVITTNPGSRTQVEADYGVEGGDILSLTPMVDLE